MREAIAMTTEKQTAGALYGGSEFSSGYGDISYYQFFWSSYQDPEDEFEVWTVTGADGRTASMVFEHSLVLLTWMEDEEFLMSEPTKPEMLSA